MEKILEKEKPLGPKELEIKPSRVDRKMGHVFYEHGGEIYKWYLHENGEVILASGDIRRLTEEVAAAMRKQVHGILDPELKKRLAAE